MNARDTWQLVLFLFGGAAGMILFGVAVYFIYGVLCEPDQKLQLCLKASKDVAVLIASAVGLVVGAYCGYKYASS